MAMEVNQEAQAAREGTMNLNLGKLSTGVYFVLLNADDGNGVRNIFKSKLAVTR
jgi:hypothetical protein